MRVALFIRNGLVGNVALNALVPQMVEMGIEPILYNTGEPYYSKADNPELKEIGFLETALLRDIVEPLMEEVQQIANVHNQDICYTNKQLAQKYSLQFKVVKNVNDPEFVKEILDDKKIIGSISIRILQIFKEDIIQAFENKGFMWNLHTGLLPKYKGVHIPYRAIENNESTYGWTLHNIDKGVDTGAIIATDGLPLNPHKPVLETYTDMSEKGVAMIMGALLFYKKYGQIKAKPQTADQTSYFTYPTSEEMQQWNNQGISFANDIVETYTKLYTVVGTSQETALRNKLTKVMNDMIVDNKVPISKAA